MAPVGYALQLAAMVALHFAAPLYQWNLGASRWWGLPFAVAGCALVVVAAGRFRRASTTLRPYEEPARLVTDGLHAWSRNPMYLGLAVSMVGAFVMLGSASPAAVVLFFFWWIRTRYVAFEERAMEERFGDAYREYARRVRRWL
ncbi:MAG: methyltransferase family protein [Myxococcota bacterium]